MRCRIVIALVVSAVAAWPAAAQLPLSLGVAGGVSLPEGDLRDGVNTGWHALGTIAVTSLMQPIGLRLDVAYNRFAFRAAAPSPLAAAHQETSSATLNLTYRLPMTNSPMSPYIIAGAGAYRSDCSQCDATTNFGWNAGAGAKLVVLGFRTFLEARYHRTEGARYFPVTFGLML